MGTLSPAACNGGVRTENAISIGSNKVGVRYVEVCVTLTLNGETENATTIDPCGNGSGSGTHTIGGIASKMMTRCIILVNGTMGSVSHTVLGVSSVYAADRTTEGNKTGMISVTMILNGVGVVVHVGATECMSPCVNNV